MIRVRIERPAGSRKAMALGFVLALVITGLLLTAKPAHAAGTTFTVNSTGDAGDVAPGEGVCDVNNIPGIDACTLRAAIQEANATQGKDTIAFNIGGGTGIKTINVGSPGLFITEPVIIDGQTQPGFDGKPSIELNGAGAGAATSGLNIQSTAGNSTVRGLVINRFGSNGINVNADNNVVTNNFVGTNPAGTTDLGIDGNGIVVKGSNNRIGGTKADERNVVSGNQFHGIVISNSSIGEARNNQVLGNFVGTDVTGTADLGNDLNGIFLSDRTTGNIVSGNVISGNDENGVLINEGANKNRILRNVIGTDTAGTADLGNSLSGILIDNAPNNTVGGKKAGPANVMAFNSADDGVGIVGSSSTGNRILRNSIFSNGDLGIDLGDDGRTNNNAGDIDLGPNILQNFPVLDSATASKGTTIKGTLNSAPNETFTIRFFSNPSSGDEGKVFIGQKSVTTNASGGTAFTFRTEKMIPVGEFITATATDSGGNTSEFSDPLAVS